MYTGMLHTHTLSVTIFLLIYLVKTYLLIFGKEGQLQAFSAKMKILEMVVSLVFLVTGIYLLMNTGNKGNWLWIKLIAVFTAIPVAIIAFKKGNKMLAFISLMLICYAYGVSETKSPTMRKEKAEAGEFDNTDPAMLGKTIFESKCVSCHGADGKLGMSGSKDLSQSTMTLEQEVAIIKNGKNAMFAFGDQLTDEQINAVAAYVETFRH